MIPIDSERMFILTSASFTTHDVRALCVAMHWLESWSMRMCTYSDIIPR